VLFRSHIVQPTNSVIVAADFSFDNEFLATGNQQESFPDVGQSMGDRMVRLWNVRNGQLVREFKDHREFILAVAFTPDGKRLLSGGGGSTTDFGAFGESCDRSIRLWDVGTGRVLRTFDGHKWRVDSLAVSPDGRHFLSGSIDRTMILWRLPD
jgi:WD40 repeat protein